jgi:hypothetical protein
MSVFAAINGGLLIGENVRAKKPILFLVLSTLASGSMVVYALLTI